MICHEAVSMIQFSCSCGQKFRIKPEFAGRKTTCPACKQPLLVPTFDSTQAIVPKDQIDGTPSSIAQVGMDGGVTLEPSGGGKTRQKPVQELLARRGKSKERYIIEAEIARGGMGAVLRAVDCDIRREVAVKYLLDQSDPRRKARFIEEAQITGQLEHPSIPPVHELGVDAQKRVFFAMKMVRGRSLAQILEELRQIEPAEKEWPLSRLLNILVSICNALAYAHSRGVVHRDLKPANVMVGDFGEVYVMDWGLAKVRGGSLSPVAGPAPSALAVTATGSSPSKVATSRDADADLTQEGAVVGTPAYMPPEQAMGKIDAVDHRSDIYSLGAILYELLTLQPPVDKEGGYLSVLMRVGQGEIVPPEQRTPQRGIPKELSAIAMKAMAKEPGQRYQNVEGLRRDIERYQEGRSVSAKEDTKREMIWKFVKRNKGLSVGAGAALIVLLSSLVAVTHAWLETGKAHAALRKQTEDAVPALLRSARLSINDRHLDDALKQIDLALTYAEKDHAEARLLKGQVLIAQKEYPKARVELERYGRLRPQDQEGQELLRLCQTAKGDDTSLFLAFADVFRRQKADAFVQQMYQHVQGDLAAKKKFLPDYQQRIQAAWPGATLSLDETKGILALNLTDRQDVTDLTPLKGMFLNSLSIARCLQVRDLTPLQGMPLTTLSLFGCSEVRDLTPLRDMPLTTLNLGDCVQVGDLTPLKGMRLTSLNISRCMQVQDLTPLQGMRLTSLSLWYCGQVRDLTPLRTLPLTTLDLRNCVQVKDLTPLKGMSLTSLNLLGCSQVQDVTPLEGMQLTELGFSPKIVNKGMEIVRSMRSLRVIYTDEKTSLATEQFWKRYDAGEFKK
jgi:serine/threonine protein kinase